MENIATRWVLPLVLLALPFSLKGQMTLSEASIPGVGDTLRQMVDNFPVGLVPGEAGGNKVWDFSTIQGLFVMETVFHRASSGRAARQFPSANAVLQLSGGVENYFQLTDGEVVELGVAGSDPIDIGMQLTGHYYPPLVSKKAPLDFREEQKQSSALIFPLRISQLPDTLFADFPFRPDSIRLRIQVERTDVADAWGILLIKEQIFNVLRVKRSEVTRTRIDVKSGFFPWIDISDIFGIGELGTQRSTTYFYYDEREKEPIVTLNADENGDIVRADYIYNDQTAADFRAAIPNERGLHVYPNPSYGMVSLNFVDLAPGRYTVRVRNILGVSKWESTFVVDGNKRAKADLSGFEPGTYLYSLVDDNNNIIRTKRLVIIRP
jgi:hypothetical protein